MSERDDSRATEPPTAKRLRELRAEGQVARSNELARTAALAASCAVFAVLWPGMWNRLEVIVVLPGDLRGMPFDAAMRALPAALASEALAIVLPLLLVVVAAGIAASLAPAGWVFSAAPLAPRFDRLSPASGLERLLSGQRIAGLVRAGAVSLAVVACAWVLLVRHFDEVARLAYCGLACIEPMGSALAGRLMLFALAPLGLVALADAVYQVHRHKLDHRMTKEEVRRERRDTEGDPHVRQRRRQAQREAVREPARALDRSMIAVRGERCVVVLRYVRGVTRLPEIMAAERGHGAVKLDVRVRSLGLRAAYEPELAEALLADGKVGAAIPARHMRSTAMLMYAVLFAADGEATVSNGRAQASGAAT